MGSPFRRQHFSSRTSGFACPIPGDGRIPPCPSIDTRECARQPALRACSLPGPARWFLHTSLPVRPVYPSSEIPGDKHRAPAPGSVRVFSGAALAGRAAQIAKGKSFRKRWSPSITARLILEQGTRSFIPRAERARETWRPFKSFLLTLASGWFLTNQLYARRKLWLLDHFLLYSRPF